MTSRSALRLLRTSSFIFLPPHHRPPPRLEEDLFHSQSHNLISTPTQSTVKSMKTHLTPLGSPLIVRGKNLQVIPLTMRWRSLFALTTLGHLFRSALFWTVLTPKAIQQIQHCSPLPRPPSLPPLIPSCPLRPFSSL